jgi:hypothetical protein
MRLPVLLDRPVDAAVRVGWHGLAVRSVIVVAAAGCWGTAAAVGTASALLTALVGAMTVLSVGRPDSGAPFGLIGSMAVMWLVGVRPPSVGWSLLLALEVLLVHVAAARAASMGDGAALGAAVARRWLGQTAVVAAATIVVWAVVTLLDHASVGGGVAVPAVALAAAAAFAVVVLVADRPERPD